MTVTVSKDFLEVLLKSKIKQITDQIKLILDRWHYTSEILFFQDVKARKIPGAENDAILLTNLMEKHTEFTGYMAKWINPT